LFIDTLFKLHSLSCFMPWVECAFIEAVGHLMCFNRWIHRFIGLKEDIHCDLFIE
jgi:hypothetical protein